MDLDRFGAMTRFMATLGTRRHVVRGGLAALGLWALGRPRVEPAAAQQRPWCTVCDGKSECRYTSIQAAIDAAPAGPDISIITICEGTYKGSITVGKNVGLVRAGVGAVVLQGTGNRSVVTVAAGVRAILEELVISGGGGRNGGGILNRGDLGVSDCVIKDNEAALGGGVYNAERAKLTLDRSIVAKNKADQGSQSFGGGIYNRSGAELIVSNGSRITRNEAVGGGGAIYNKGSLTIRGKSRLDNNRSLRSEEGGFFDGNGGAILNNDGTVTIDDSSVQDNEAEEEGGGIAILTGGVLIRNTTNIEGNRARRGGGIYHQGDDFRMTLIDSAVFDNKAEERGGGFHTFGFVTLQNCRVTRNDAGIEGGGIYSGTGAVTIDDQSRVVGNDPNNCEGTGTSCDRR